MLNSHILALAIVTYPGRVDMMTGSFVSLLTCPQLWHAGFFQRRHSRQEQGNEVAEVKMRSAKPTLLAGDLSQGR